MADWENLFKMAGEGLKKINDYAEKEYGHMEIKYNQKLDSAKTELSRQLRAKTDDELMKIYRCAELSEWKKEVVDEEMHRRNLI